MKRRQVVRHIDLAPTILDVLGLPWPGMEGQSLKPVIENENHPGFEAISEAHLFDWCLRTNKWKYFERLNIDRPFFGPSLKLLLRSADIIVTNFIRMFKFKGLKFRALYDLENDPLEKNNLIKRNPAKAKELRDRLLGYIRKTRPHKQAVKRTDSAEEEKVLKERLEALGYID